MLEYRREKAQEMKKFEVDASRGEVGASVNDGADARSVLKAHKGRVWISQKCWCVQKQKARIH